jgi:hypothetical protein
MANQKLIQRKSNIARFPLAGIPLDYCPNSPDTRHEFIQQEYDPEVKSCFWCRLLVIPENSPESD